jgi:uncharacterized membrane protein
MSADFKGGKFFDGVSRAIRTVGAELAAHFPPSAADRDELSNDVVEH